jgi:hypothetical protein
VSTASAIKRGIRNRSDKLMDKNEYQIGAVARRRV